jgi:hypothetical protein
MSIRRILPLLLTLLVVAFVGIWAWVGLKSPPLSESRGIITTPAGWQLMDAGSFTLYAPKGTQVRQAQRGDLVYGDIIGPNTCLLYSVGPKATVIAGKSTHPAYTETPIVIDGRHGVVRKAVLNQSEQSHWFGDCGAALYVALYLPQALPGGGSVAIEGTAGSEDARDQVETIFKSIRFARTR